jgi:hypothetical protein
MSTYTKRCSNCKVDKNLSEFSINRSTPGGYHYYCKICAALKNKEWRDNNPDKCKVSRKKYVEKVKRENAGLMNEVPGQANLQFK